MTQIPSGSPFVTTDEFVTLSTDIVAIQVMYSNEGSDRLGPVSRLPRGARVVTRGNGFDEHTVRVMCEGQTYFVFLKDLEGQPRSFASAV